MPPYSNFQTYFILSAEKPLIKLFTIAQLYKMQIKLSESPVRNHHPKTLSPMSKSQMKLNLKPQLIKTENLVSPLNRGHYINELSAKIQVMQQKIKDRIDNISPSNMRRSEKMTKVKNSNSSSRFNYLAANNPHSGQESRRRSFQDNTAIGLAPETEKEAIGIKQNKTQGKGFMQLLEADKLVTKQNKNRKNENQLAQIQLVQSFKFEIPPIYGLNRDQQFQTKSVFFSNHFNRAQPKQNDKDSKNKSKEIFSPKIINKSAIQPKTINNMQPVIKKDKIFNSINKSLSIIEMMKSLQIQKRQKLHKNSVDRQYCKEFEVGIILGKGKFGQVFLAKHINSGFFAALKKISKAKLKDYNIVDQFIQELKLHNAMNHPNIVKFYGVFEEQDSFYMVLEYMNGGTLFDYLNIVGTMKIKETVEFLKDIIEALSYMHERSIAHRDIKPENIVISTEGVAKLCDLGWAAIVESTRRTYCGTLDYACPEILQQKSYDISVDIWSIGVLTYQMLMGKAPFEDKDRAIVRNRIVNSDNFQLTYSKNVPQQAREFIQWLLQRDPSKRPKVNELLSHKMFLVYSSKPTKKAW